MGTLSGLVDAAQENAARRHREHRAVRWTHPRASRSRTVASQRCGIFCEPSIAICRVRCASAGLAKRSIRRARGGEIGIDGPASVRLDLPRASRPRRSGAAPVPPDGAVHRGPARHHAQVGDGRMAAADHAQLEQLRLGMRDAACAVGAPVEAGRRRSRSSTAQSKKGSAVTTADRRSSARCDRPSSSGTCIRARSTRPASHRPQREGQHPATQRAPLLARLSQDSSVTTASPRVPQRQAVNEEAQRRTWRLGPARSAGSGW